MHMGAEVVSLCCMCMCVFGVGRKSVCLKCLQLADCSSLYTFVHLALIHMTQFIDFSLMLVRMGMPRALGAG
jgi:hypothetical protein